MKIDEEEVKEHEKPKQPTDMVDCYVPFDVRVNSHVYRGKCRVPLATHEVIAEAVGKKTMRIMREMTGGDYRLEALTSGGFAPVLVNQVGPNGERVG